MNGVNFNGGSLGGSHDREGEEGLHGGLPYSKLGRVWPLGKVRNIRGLKSVGHKKQLPADSKSSGCAISSERGENVSIEKGGLREKGDENEGEGIRARSGCRRERCLKVSGKVSLPIRGK